MCHVFMIMVHTIEKASYMILQGVRKELSVH